MKTIAIFNRKGGAGKTTCAASMGALLAKVGYRVLMVDTDSQANLTSYFNIDASAGDVSSAFGGGRLPVKSINLMLHIVPASLHLAAVDYELANKEDRYDLIKQVLIRENEGYDFVLMDLAPAMNHLSISAVAACDYLLCPVLPDVDSLAGLKLAEEVCFYAGKDGIDGIFLSCYNARRRVDREVEAALRGEYGDSVLQSTIRQCSKLRECRLYNIDIGTYAPHSTGGQDYLALTKELLARIK